MCVNSLKPKVVNYGQGRREWNPSDRAPVYQAVERAKKDAAFANDFAYDILLAKSDSVYGSRTIRSGQYGDNIETKTVYGMQPSDKFKREHALNPAKSWVNQAFGSPVLRYGDAWYAAVPIQGGGFKKGDKVSDQQTIRMLSEGNYAFTFEGKGVENMKTPKSKAELAAATAANKARNPIKKGPLSNAVPKLTGDQLFNILSGTLYVPWAAGFTPAKGGQGKPEAGNAKKETVRGGAARDMVRAETARPGNVLAGEERVLLGSGGNNNDGNASRVLLGR